MAFVLALAAPAVLAADTRFDDDFIAGALARAGQQPQQQVTVDIAAPPSYVFDFMRNRLPEYLEGVKAVSFSTGQASGRLERTSQLENGETLVQRFIVDEPGVQYAYFTDMAASTVSAPLAYTVTAYQFLANESGGTRVTVAIDYEPSPRWMGFIVRRAFNRAFREDYQRAAMIISEAFLSETPRSQNSLQQ